MDGLEDALRLIQDTAVAASPLVKLEIEDDRKAHFLDRAGKVVTLDIPPATRAHEINTVDDLCQLSNRAKAMLIEGEPIIWHDHTKLVLVMEDGDRRDRATMTLHESLHLGLLRSQVQRPAVSQADLIQLLRVKLGTAVVNGPSIVANLRKVKFTLIEGAGAEVQRGKESIDLEVQREVAGVEDLAELVQVSVPVYSNAGESDLRFPIMCSLDIDFVGKRFIFAPLPGEIETAIDRAQADIRKRIVAQAKDIPIFNGRP